MSKEGTLNALSKEQAYQLADITKTPPQFGALTPRWLTMMWIIRCRCIEILQKNKQRTSQTSAFVAYTTYDLVNYRPNKKFFLDFQQQQIC